MSISFLSSDNAGLLAYIEALPRHANEATLETAEDIVADAETAMRLPKGGRQYGDHIASAPGDAPAIDTTELVDSAAATSLGQGQAEASWSAPHAKHMEFGAEDVEPRPFATPAADANRQALIDNLADRLKG